MDKKRKPNTEEEIKKPIVYGNPEYAAAEDIYSKEEKVSFSEDGTDSDVEESQIEKDSPADDLDIPGTELDDADEEIGEEDEEKRQLGHLLRQPRQFIDVAGMEPVVNHSDGEEQRAGR